MKLRWIPDKEPRDAAINMAMDEYFLDCCEAEPRNAGVVIRFYRWSRPTASLGRYQKAAEALDLDACRRLGVDVVRRPTGGRAVLHHTEITYSVAGPHSVGRLQGTIDHTYHLISSALSRGLNSYGVPARMEPGRTRRGTGVSGRGQASCFASVARHELVANGRKLVGSAQRRLRQSFLQHGSILLYVDRELWRSTIRGVDDGALAKMIGVSELTKSPAEFDPLVETFVNELGRSLEARVETQPLSSDEQEAVAERVITRFGSDGWTYRH